MFFLLIRIALWVILSYIVVRIIYTSNIVRKKASVILAVVFSLLITTVSSMFPFENLFVHNKSPESIFNYANPGKIDKVLYGDDSCMVIYSKYNGVISQYIIPKTDNGYIFPTYFTANHVLHKFDKNGLIDVYNAKNTQDYYVFASFNLSEHENDICVFNRESERVNCSMYRVEDSGFVFFSLTDLSEGYYLIINGDKVMLYD